MSLSQRKCVPCEGEAKPLSKAKAAQLQKKVPGWTLNGNAKMISRELVMKNFTSAVKLIGKVADIANAEDHHPDVHLTSYRNLKIELSTHAIKGLSENDFIVAAKINELPMELKK